MHRDPLYRRVICPLPDPQMERALLRPLNALRQSVEGRQQRSESRVFISPAMRRKGTGDTAYRLAPQGDLGRAGTASPRNGCSRGEITNYKATPCFASPAIVRSVVRL